MCRAYVIFNNNSKDTRDFYVVRQLAYVHGVVPRCKDFHLYDLRYTVSLMWYETPSLHTTLLET